MSEEEYQSEYTLEELREIYGADTKGVGEITALFVEDAPPRLRLFTEAMASEDYAAAAKAAHGLTNLLGALRNHAGATIARNIEHNLRQGKGGEASRQEHKLRAEVQKTLDEIGAAQE